MLSTVITLAAEAESESVIHPYAVGGIAFAILLVLLLAVVSFGGGREQPDVPPPAAQGGDVGLVGNRDLLKVRHIGDQLGRHAPVFALRLQEHLQQFHD